MVLEVFKDLFKKSEYQYQLIVGSSMPVSIPESIYRAYPMPHPAENLAEAQRVGIHPVNFHQLTEQFDKKQFDNAVLFDTPIGGTGIGNHWRIIHIHTNSNAVTMQFCGSFGNYDYPIPRITVSRYDILFTGLTIFEYKHDNKRIPLSQVVEIAKTPDEYKKTKEQIYVADINGMLLPIENLYPIQ